MRKLRLRIYGDEVLRKKTRYIKTFDDGLLKLIDNMFEVMYQSNGIGLAAPQVGISKKLVVVDTQEEGESMALVNPKIVWKSSDTDAMNEGCLSIPDIEGEVVRSERIKVKANDPETGEEYTFETSGLLARCIQHEIDHLDGVLFVDHLTDEDKATISRKLHEMAAA